MRATSEELPETGLAELSSSEKRRLKMAGRLFAVSDLVWIAQAWLIASVVAGMVPGTPIVSMASALFPFGELAAVVLLAFVRTRLTLAAGKMAMVAAQAVKTRVRDRLLRAISSASPASPMPSSGEVAAQIGDQVDALGPYLLRFYPQKIRLGIVPPVIALAVLPVSWLAALILMIAGPIIPVFMALIGMRAKAASERQQAELTRMSGFLLDRIRGLETLRLFGAIERTRSQIDAVGEAFRVGTMKVLRIAFLSSTALELFSALGIASIAIYVGSSLLGAFEAGAWGAPLTIQTGLFVLLLTPEFFAPLRAYAAAYHDRAAGLAAKDKLSALYTQISTSSEVAPLAVSIAEPIGSAKAVERRVSPAVSIENASLALAGRPVLRNLSLRIEAGESVLLVGPSGAGKTTVLDCLLGLHRLDSGAVSIGGTATAELDLQAWRNSVAWVGQAPRLFHGSLKANLLRGNPDANEDDMWTALALAGATDLVQRLPRGLGTIVGEDGFGLSVGEMRRIALARAAIRSDAALILADEPTAGLDDETAADVISGLQKLADGRSFVAATHDPKLMAITARQIRLDAGAEAMATTAEEGAA
ncbi:thiol reductant ABC exporter subunit CydD [Roseibium sp.]|uniref:thiol reductant ABC exporter subunit CydD n=1 Tax=Roseibium sp. TaxID=1936156 RepID=UPI003A982C91